MGDRWIGAVGIAVLCTAGIALADGMEVEPGKWEFKSVSEAPAAPTSITRVDTECLKEPEIDPRLFMQDSKGCEILDPRSDSSSMSWKITCPSPAGAMTGEAAFRSTGKTVQGSMTMSMTVNGQKMNFAQKVEGRHLGPCG